MNRREYTEEELLEFNEIDRQEAREVDKCEYLFKMNPYNEFETNISFTHEDGWTWRKHPDNPFPNREIMRWKEKAEMWDMMVDAEAQSYDKLKAIKKFVITLSDEWDIVTDEDDNLVYDYQAFWTDFSTLMNLCGITQEDLEEYQ